MRDGRPARRAVVVCLVGVLALLGPTLAGAAGSTPAQAAHLLSRLDYGPRPGDIAALQAMGADAWIERQLDPRDIPLPEDLRRRLEALETLRMTPIELFREFARKPRERQAGARDPAAAKAERQRARRVLGEAFEARLLRAIESPRQLEEVMVEFWFDHFNVFAGKGLDRLWTGAFEQQAIRPHVLGRFRDLLGATAKHPAMLFYLDNWRNTAPGSPAAKGRFEGLNENYARELMELHTLGVDGGYTQADVVSLARILTGWGLPRRGAGRRAAAGNGFWFDEQRHDFTTKVFLGQRIAGSGIAEGEQALDLLASSPATARHIAFKLAQFFVADVPDPALVESLAGRFSATDGDIAEVLRTLFASAQFRGAANHGAKFKSPWRFVVSALRAGARRVNDARPVYGVLAQLGQPPYGRQTPDGWPHTQAAWLNPDAITRRISLATAFASGRLRFLAAPDASVTPVAGGMDTEREAGGLDADALLATLGPIITPDTRATVRSEPAALRAALVLGSPDFQRH